MEAQIARKTPSFRHRDNTKAMEKLKDAVIRLSSFRSSPLSPSQIDERLRSLFTSSPPLCTPVHPPYSEMIIAAIRGLSERRGSKEESISNFIKSRHQDLPFAHARLLTHHLEKLIERGEIVFAAKSRYGLPNCDPNPNFVKQSEQKKNKKCSRRRGGKSKTRRDREHNGELQLVVRDKMITSPESHLTPLYYYSEGLDKRRRIDGDGVEEKSKPECLGGQELLVQDEILSVTGDRDDDRSSQLQLASVTEEERLQDPNGQNESHHGVLKLVVKDQREESVCKDNVYILSPQLQLMPVIEIEPLQSNLNKQVVLLPPPEQHGEQESVAKTSSIGDDSGYTPEQHGEQEIVLKDQMITSMGDDNLLSPQLQITPVIEIEPLQKSPNKPNEMLPLPEECGEQELVVKDPTAMVIGEDNGYAVSPQLHLTSMIEMEPFQNPNRQNVPLEQGRSRNRYEPEQQERMMTSEGDDNTCMVLPHLRITPEPLEKSPNEQNELPPLHEQCGEPESAEKDQLAVLIGEDNGYTVSPQLHSTSIIEMEPLQQPNKLNVPLRRGRSKTTQELQQHREKELAAKDKMATSVVEEATSVIQMEQFHCPNRQDESPQQQQGEKKKQKGHQGRPKKKRDLEDHEQQELVVKDQTTTAVADDSGLIQSSARHNEQQQQQKRKDGRGRPKKRPCLENQGEQQLVLRDYIITAKCVGGHIDNVLMVLPIKSPAIRADPLQKKKDGRGRPKKIKPEFELHVEKRLEVGPSQKKKDGRGRPKKKKPDSEQPLKVNPLQKKKDGRGRPKKKKPEFEQQGEKQLVLQDGKMMGSVDEHGSTPLIELKPKRGPGRPKKNRDPTELLLKQQLPRRRRGRPPLERKEMEASNAAVGDDQNSLKAHNESTDGPLGIELVPCQEKEKLDCEVVEELSTAPPPRKVSKVTLKYLQEPQLPRRKLRPRHPLSETFELNQPQPLSTQS